MCACMINLDQAANSTEKDSDSCCLFIDRTTTNEAFQSSLIGPNLAEGWIYGVDRFGCASDVGEWCIYCERRNEIAAVAFRTHDSSLKFEPIVKQLEALPIILAIEKPLSYGFTPSA